MYRVTDRQFLRIPMTEWTKGPESLQLISRGQLTFSLRHQRDVSSFPGHIISVTATQLRWQSSHRWYIQEEEWLCFNNTLFTKTGSGHIWPIGHSLPTPWSEVMFGPFCHNENLRPEKHWPLLSIKPSLLNSELARFHYILLFFPMKLIKWIHQINQNTGLLNVYQSKAELFCGSPGHFLKLGVSYILNPGGLIPYSSVIPSSPQNAHKYTLFHQNVHQWNSTQWNMPQTSNSTRTTIWNSMDLNTS